MPSCLANHDSISPTFPSTLCRGATIGSPASLPTPIVCALQDLREIALRKRCNVHAYVLMTNHVHLLMTPTASGQISRVMQSLGRRYVRYINDRYRRTGTLWEGRSKSSLVDGETYLFRCYRYIELNPVRARMTVDPLDYAWSSHTCNAFGRDDPLISAHPACKALGNSDIERQGAYRTLAMENLSQDELDAIRAHLQRQRKVHSGPCPCGFKTPSDVHFAYFKRRTS